MNVGQLNRNVALLQLEQKEGSKDVRDDIRINRNKQREAKIESLDKNEEAGKLRGDANDAATRYQATAAALTAAAAAAAFIPYVGAVIAAVLLAVAAVFAILAHLEREGKEQEAAQLEMEAGLDDIRAEGAENRIEDIKESDDDRQAYLDQTLEKLNELKKQDADQAKF